VPSADRAAAPAELAPAKPVGLAPDDAAPPGHLAGRAGGCRGGDAGAGCRALASHGALACAAGGSQSCCGGGRGCVGGGRGASSDGYKLVRAAGARCAGAAAAASSLAGRACPHESRAPRPSDHLCARAAAAGPLRRLVCAWAPLRRARTAPGACRGVKCC
jgi:hypothetical protein